MLNHDITIYKIFIEIGIYWDIYIFFPPEQFLMWYTDIERLINTVG